MSPRLRSIPFLLSTLIVTGLIPIGGCSLESTPPDPPQWQTSILSVGADPNPVAVGDSTTFTVVIADSLDSSFEFTWYVDGYPPRYSDSPTITLPAPSNPGTYHAGVSADNGDGFKNTPNRGFTLIVVPSP